MTDSYIQKYGPALAADYPVCAIKPGDKCPIGKEWQLHPLSPEECRYYPVEGAGLGILCGIGDKPCYAIDVDVIGDKDCAEAILKMIEGVCHWQDIRYRVGNAPKLLVPVIGVEAGWKKQTTPWFEKEGVRARVEFLGAGQQFVAAAVHPVTKRPYEWHGIALMGDLLDVPEGMPHVSLAQVQEVMQKAAAIMAEHGWAQASGGEAIEGTPLSADELAPQYPIGVSIEEVRTWLSDQPGASDYETWLRVGMALHHEFGKGAHADEAFALWNEWSMTADNYKGAQDLEYRWAGFGRRTGRSVTCRWLQYEYQRRHYDKAAEPTEEGRAARFASYFRGAVRYAVDSGEWYQWNGLFWRKLYPSEAEGLASYAIDELLRFDIDAQEKAGKDDKAMAAWNALYRNLQRGNKAGAILAEARKHKIIHCLSTDFDSTPRYFGVRNGVIDLETMEFLKPEPAMFVTMRAGAEYDPDAKCPVWEKTVSDAFFDDPAMIDYVQRLFGYAMLGNPVEEVMAILFGNGCNGKSTIVNVLRDMFGDYGHTARADLITSIGKSYSNAGGARADIMALKGKRLVVVSEIDQSAKMRESEVKALVSTDEVSARGMYQSTVTTFRPSWLVTMLTNHLPEIDGVDEGIWRRLHAVPFDRDFNKDPEVEKDVDRARKLRAELSGILNWVLAGVKKYREHGLNRPTKVEEQSAWYRQNQDVVAQWLEERCEGDGKDDTKALPVSIAWSSWEAFARSQSTYGGCFGINSKSKLTRELSRRGIKSTLIYHGGKMQRCYVGIELADGEFM